MLRLKMKLFLLKYKKIISILLLIVFAIILSFGFCKVSSKMIIENPTVFGVIGTLVGAVIGGFFSLMGSVWVNSKQQRATQNIKRKNVIYSPLYDELVDIQDRILQQNPYPRYIAFEKETQTIIPYPQFLAWKRIKADSRYLEVPNILIKQMDELENVIHRYLEVRQKVSDEVQAILNDILKENELKICCIRNIGDVISSDILSNNKIDIYNKAMEYGREKQLDDDIRMDVNKKIYDRCDKNITVLEVRKRYGDWMKIQQETIEILGLLIKQVLLKYEG